MMRPHEAVGIADFGSDFAVEIATRAHEAHEAIADRVYAAVPMSRPVQLVHRSVERGVDRAVRFLLPATMKTAGRALAALLPLAAKGDELPSIDRFPLGNQLVATANGFFGDQLITDANPIALTMGLRTELPDGRAVDLPIKAAAFSELLPRVTPEVIVFVHGLSEIERAWTFQSERHWGEPGSSHGTRLADDLGLTPLFVRYNSGQRISASGRELHLILERIVASWPVPVERLVIVGHSMGGLVTRSACDAAARTIADGADVVWPEVVSDMVLLGAPNNGSGLERVVNNAIPVMDRIGELAPFGRFLQRRAVGIKDLRHGSVRDEDWEAHHVDHPHDVRTDALVLDAMRVHAIGTTMSRDPESHLGRRFGDLLVNWASSSGSGDGREQGFTSRTFLPSMTHFGLLNHPEVYAVVRDVLTPEPASG